MIHLPEPFLHPVYTDYTQVELIKVYHQPGASGRRSHKDGPTQGQCTVRMFPLPDAQPRSSQYHEAYKWQPLQHLSNSTS